MSTLNHFTPRVPPTLYTVRGKDLTPSYFQGRTGLLALPSVKPFAAAVGFLRFSLLVDTLICERRGLKHLIVGRVRYPKYVKLPPWRGKSSDLRR